MRNPNIDSGIVFDWGRTSADYSKWRDIYPQAFYDKIIALGVGVEGQRILDVGTGTGVLPRNLCRHGARWTGVDAAANQIEEARRLSHGLDIDYLVSTAEDIPLRDASFDAITACQCYWYFDHAKAAPEFARLLKPHGRLVFLCMEWLPFEDAIARASEELVLKFNPAWSGAGSTMQPIEMPKCYGEYFRMVSHCEWTLDVPFTRESWNGRMKTCRGIGASLPPDAIAEWEQEHMAMLARMTQESFIVKHYAALFEMEAK